VLAPDIPANAIKPWLEWPVMVKPVQRFSQSDKGIIREVRRIIGAVGQPEKPLIQTAVMLGHKLFASVLLVPELQWLTGFNHSSRSRCAFTKSIAVRRGFVRKFLRHSALHPFTPDLAGRPASAALVLHFVCRATNQFSFGRFRPF